MSRQSQRKVRLGRTADQRVTGLPRGGEWENWLWGLLLVAATILVYQQAWHAGFIWDDDVYVTENKLLTAPDGLKRIWFSFDSPSQYFPLVYTSFRLEHALWGLRPAGYHWVNILLHAANAVLVWRLLLALRVPGAWLAAAIFALHPVHVESVAWVTERKNVLMGLFFLLALLAWVKFVEASARQRWKYYSLALVFYALALFSKTTACTLPAALLLILWLKGTRIDWRRLAQIAPFVVLGIGMGLVTVWWERYHQGTQGELFQIGLPERVLVACRALWFYAGKLLWPANLVFSYRRWTISASNLLDYAWVLATGAAAAVIYFARHRLGRGPEVAALFFAATLSPMLGFIMLYTFRYSFVADHYQYLASIGPLALAAAGVTRALEAFGKTKRFLKSALYAVVLAPLGLLTWKQCAMYAGADSLWWATLAKNPESWMAHNNIAISLLGKGKVEEAVVHYNKALELDPNYSEAHFNLGNALLRLGRVDEAIAHYEKALETNPNNIPAHYNLAGVLAQSGRTDAAIDRYNKILEKDPNHAAAHNNLGAALARAGRVNEAMAHYLKALELNPSNGEAHYNFGNTLLQAGRVGEAMTHYDKALELNPNNAAAHNKLASILRQMGRTDEADAHSQKALEIDRRRRP
ncbi:MAG TPA: tetratricopeptide repeat protein [Chthoniobacterales bacterium]|nr:tetratricopeptide repeat protein [Chthoniobacterales bacterium]